MAVNNPDKNQNINDVLEKISESIVLCDEKDYKALADLHTLFEKAREWALESKEDRIKDIFVKIIGMLEDIILESSADSAQDLENIGQAVMGLQPVIRGKKISWMFRYLMKLLVTGKHSSAEHLFLLMLMKIYLKILFPASQACLKIWNSSYLF